MALLFLLWLPMGAIMAVAFLGYALGRARRRYSRLRSAAGLLCAVAAGAVPGYINVVVYGCAVVAALCAGAAAVGAERRGRPTGST